MAYLNGKLIQLTLLTERVSACHQGHWEWGSHPELKYCADFGAANESKHHIYRNVLTIARWFCGRRDLVSFS
jgi:hypothetical protein